MKKTLALLIFLCALFAVIAQYWLMMEGRTETAVESTIRFFSYFTILTNSLVAIYFFTIVIQSFSQPASSSTNFATLTAVAVYITIVGLVYQVVLRPLWSPTGLQKIVDEMLHSVNPVLVIVYWFFSKKGQVLHYRLIPGWLVYPLVYLVFVLIRGSFSGFYPYPFLTVSAIGLGKAIINSIGITILFVIISAILIFLTRGKTLVKKGY